MEPGAPLEGAAREAGEQRRGERRGLARGVQAARSVEDLEEGRGGAARGDVRHHERVVLGLLPRVEGEDREARLTASGSRIACEFASNWRRLRSCDR